jgi:hypothetical protein
LHEKQRGKIKHLAEFFKLDYKKYENTSGRLAAPFKTDIRNGQGRAQNASPVAHSRVDEE